MSSNDAGWVDVAPAADLTDGGILSVEVEGLALLLARCGERLHAVEDRCTHDGEPLGSGEVESCEIICPRHFARFSLRTGEALTPPAYEPLRTYPVREQNGRILVQV